MKVTMYKANDGSLHETQKACDAKNVELRTAPLVEDFVNGLKDEDLACIDGAYVIPLAELPGFIVAHADALRTLLNKAVNPVGRPRKSADPAKPRKPRADKGTKRPTARGQDSNTGPTSGAAVNVAAAKHGVHGGDGATLSAGATLDDVLADLS